MKKKNFVSLSMAFSFLALSVTGILIYIKQSPEVIKNSHAVFGLIFVGVSIFHIINNWSSLVNYTKDRKFGKIQKEFWLPASIFTVLVGFGLAGFLEPVAEAGRIFAGKRPPRQEKLSFDEISTNKDLKGTNLQLIIQKNKDVDFPVMAIWAENADGSFAENLFVPAKIAVVGEGEEAFREAKFKGEFERKPFSADILPTFKAKTKDAKANFEKVTPTENFVLTTSTSAKGAFKIFVEIKDKDKTELYEADVDAAKSEAFKLKSKENILIKNGIVELN